MSCRTLEVASHGGSPPRERGPGQMGTMLGAALAQFSVASSRNLGPCRRNESQISAVLQVDSWRT